MALAAPRYFVLVLTLFMLAGHVCELPIEAVVDWHIHEGGQASPDHHGHDRHTDEGQISCDPVVGIQPSGGVHVDRSPGVAAKPVSLERSSVVRIVAVARHES